MKSLQNFHSSNYIKLLAYGDSGVGKTCFASTFPGPVAFLDFDNKLSSALNYLRATRPEKVDEISYSSFSTNRVTDRPYRAFQEELLALEKLVKEGKFHYKTVVLDSLTLYSEALMADTIQSNPNVKRAIAGHPGMQDYGLVGTYFRNDMGRLLALPCNVICIGHIKELTDEMTMAVSYKVMLSGQLANYAPKIFREVYMAFSREEKDGSIKRYLQTQPSKKFECRTEFMGMPPVIPMDLSEILKYQQPIKDVKNDK